MAYRNPLSGQWPDFFADDDLNALVEVWGRKYDGLEMVGRYSLVRITAKLLKNREMINLRAGR